MGDSQGSRPAGPVEQAPPHSPRKAGRRSACAAALVGLVLAAIGSCELPQPQLPKLEAQGPPRQTIGTLHIAGSLVARKASELARRVD